MVYLRFYECDRIFPMSSLQKVEVVDASEEYGADYYLIKFWIDGGCSDNKISWGGYTNHEEAQEMFESISRALMTGRSVEFKPGMIIVTRGQKVTTFVVCVKSLWRKIWIFHKSKLLWIISALGGGLLFTWVSLLWREKGF